MLQKYKSLDRPNRAALWQAGPRLLWVWATLPILGIKRLQPSVAPAAKTSTSQVEQSRADQAMTSKREVEPWQTRARAIQRIAARLPNCRCLPRALTLARWMAAEGLNPEFKLGYRSPSLRNDEPEQTRNGEPEPVAHAWIELNGHPIGETKESLTGLTPLAWPQIAESETRNRRPSEPSPRT